MCSREVSALAPCAASHRQVQGPLAAATGWIMRHFSRYPVLTPSGAVGAGGAALRLGHAESGGLKRARKCRLLWFSACLKALLTYWNIAVSITAFCGEKDRAARSETCHCHE